jgi:FSR family fosmidomycin resistance protein-like MFS transporter
MIRQAGFVWAPIYSVTFFRERFDLSLASGALFIFGLTTCFAVGSFLGGQLVNRIGRKRLLITTLLASTLGLAILPFMPNLWFALILVLASVFVNALGFSGTANLTLEQVPEFRGTMMSLHGICLSLGFGLGTGLGGAALALFKNYTSLFLTFFSLNIIAVIVYFFLTKDPCRTSS